ncbi:hypothetical protein Tco_1257697 [Tanacetum coccineum]
MAPKRTSTSAAPAMTQATIRKLVANSVVAALEAQATTMANTNNTNMNTGPREDMMMSCGHAYHEGEEILKEDRKEYEFQWQRNC